MTSLIDTPLSCPVKIHVTESSKSTHFRVWKPFNRSTRRGQRLKVKGQMSNLLLQVHGEVSLDCPFRHKSAAHAGQRLIDENTSHVTIM